MVARGLSRRFIAFLGVRKIRLALSHATNIVQLRAALQHFEITAL